MLEIKFVTEEEKRFWFTLDQHLPEQEFYHIVQIKRGYVIKRNNKPVGVFRWNLFWDSIPFLTMIYLKENERDMGIGREVMSFWEREMKNEGYTTLMTSTQVDETAQHFYRKLGFQDCGCLVLNNIPELEQPMEMFFLKSII